MSDAATYVLIPAYEPVAGLVPLVAEVRALGLPVLVVDDGSSPECAPVFAALEADGVEVVHHDANRGKGAALKTGMRLLAERGVERVVTADADGQHLPHDIAAVAEAAREHPRSLVLGVRDIASMPPRSKAGNTVTRLLTGVISNVHVSDTQTGLRAFPLERVDELCALGGDGYEFEMAMLVKTAGLFDAIVEVPIETVYEPHNATSHFRPVHDGLRVTSVLLRMLPAYLVISMSSFVIDYILFALLDLVAGLGVVWATVAARVISATFNYTCNRLFVFRVSGRAYTPLRYFGLAAFILALNSGLMWLFSDLLGLPPLAVKIPVEALLYIVSFSVQSNLAARDTPRGTVTNGG